MSDFDRCPEIEYAPRTPEGRAVIAILERPGVWQWAGMSAALTGLDLAAALTSLPQYCDVEFARGLLIEAEVAYVAAWWRDAESRTEKKKDNVQS